MSIAQRLSNWVQGISLTYDHAGKLWKERALEAELNARTAWGRNAVSEMRAETMQQGLAVVTEQLEKLSTVVSNFEHASGTTLNTFTSQAGIIGETFRAMLANSPGRYSVLLAKCAQELSEAALQCRAAYEHLHGDANISMQETLEARIDREMHHIPMPVPVVREPGHLA